jgi:hypothetical protein
MSKYAVFFSAEDGIVRIVTQNAIATIGNFFEVHKTVSWKYEDVVKNYRNCNNVWIEL